MSPIYTREHQRVERLHRPISGTILCEHNRVGDNCGIEAPNGRWYPKANSCGRDNLSDGGVIHMAACAECRVGPDGCDMPDGLEGWGQTVLIEETGWRHMPWPCATINALEEEHDGRIHVQTP